MDCIYGLCMGCVYGLCMGMDCIWIVWTYVDCTDICMDMCYWLYVWICVCGLCSWIVWVYVLTSGLDPSQGPVQRTSGLTPP